MQRPPLFESDGFLYWKNRFETYVKSKDLDIWHVITFGDFPPTQQNPFQRRGRFTRSPRDEIKPFQRNGSDNYGKRKCFRCGSPNHHIGECLKPPGYENQGAFVSGTWSDSDKEEVEKPRDEKCFVAKATDEICLGIDLEPDEWIKDSGCSRHMTGNRKLFSTYKAYNGGNAIFGSDLCGKIIGKGTISQDSLTIENVEHVDNLTYNLLSIG
jgi:hypothetical protein